MLAWFIGSYKRDVPNPSYPSIKRRYPEIRDFIDAIRADGGKYQAVEILGNKFIAKVNASASTIAAIAGVLQRIPLNLIDESLSSLPTGQRNAIRQAVLDCGYTTEEVNATFPNLASKTLGDVLRFMASRRLKPRYDQATDTIVCDGAVQSCESIDLLNEEIV